jgi:hypothetical protein
MPPPRVAARMASVTEDQHGTTRIKQSQSSYGGSPTRSKPGPSALQGGPSYRKGGTVLPNATPLLDEVHVQICWRAASKTRRPTHRHASVRRCDKTYHGLHQTLHTTTPLKMKQNNAMPACSDPNNTTRTLSGARLLGGRLGDGRKPLRGPRWQQQSRSGTRSKDQAPAPECRHDKGPHQQ